MPQDHQKGSSTKDNMISINSDHQIIEQAAQSADYWAHMDSNHLIAHAADQAKTIVQMVSSAYADAQKVNKIVSAAEIVIKDANNTVAVANQTVSSANNDATLNTSLSKSTSAHGDTSAANFYSSLVESNSSLVFSAASTAKNAQQEITNTEQLLGSANFKIASVASMMASARAEAQKQFTHASQAYADDQRTKESSVAAATKSASAAYDALKSITANNPLIDPNRKL